ncbi:MAG TPA: hypothetical protein VGK99_24225 [Acidobacteriota bacterium]|jgi:hypothetical protein
MRNEDVIERPAEQTTITKLYTDEAVKFIKDNQSRCTTRAIESSARALAKSDTRSCCLAPADKIEADKIEVAPVQFLKFG